MKGTDELKEFVEGLEMTVLADEDSILLDGMVGTSGLNGLCNTDANCTKSGCTNNCHGANCAAGCAKAKSH